MRFEPLIAVHGACVASSYGGCTSAPMRPKENLQMHARTGMRHPLLVLLVAALGISLVVAVATDASAKRKPPKYNQSRAEFVADYRPPDRFTCKYVDKERGQVVDDYRCSAPGADPILLAQMLQADTELPLPPGSGWKYLAAPDGFQCHWTGKKSRTADQYKCSYRHRHSRHGRLHIHRYRLSETTLAQPADMSGTVWYPPHPVRG